MIVVEDVVKERLEKLFYIYIIVFFDMIKLVLSNLNVVLEESLVESNFIYDIFMFVNIKGKVVGNGYV